MSVRNLDKMFAPRSIALIGASTKSGSVGAALMRNLLHAGFSGPVFPVNPHATSIQGVLAYRDVTSLPSVPDLAVIATPPAVIPSLIAELGNRGTRAVVVITAGLADQDGLRQQLLDAARPHLIRIIGPNCLGIAVPSIGLNATFGPSVPLAGKIAFLTQSGAMATTVLDWALPRGIGFSAIVSMGDMTDVDFGDLLDYLALDDGTTAILIYAEAVTQARKFMSAARRAARVKPVIIVKAGRVEEGARAAASHTGALAGADSVYEAAFRRAGMLRVHEIDELFDAAATLARMAPHRGDRLAIVTNGGGLGVLATDRLIEEGGRLATLAPSTIARLDAVLPSTWSKANPVDIIGDADARRYSDAVSILSTDPHVDGILVVNCPTGVSSPVEAANGLLEALPGDPSSTPRPHVLASWMGDATAREGRARLIAAGIPHYDTVERAVRAFMHLVRYQESQELLLQTPSSSAPSGNADVLAARALLHRVIADQREWLDPAEVAAFLQHYNISVARTEAVPDAAEAARLAGEIQGPVALKIRSRDIIHKSDVGGVVLNLVGSGEVATAADRMVSRVAEALPHARIEGFIVQEMVVRPGAYELIAGITTDPIFGPVLLVGHGGTAVEVVRDKALELPPLNNTLRPRPNQPNTDIVAVGRISRPASRRQRDACGAADQAWPDRRRSCRNHGAGYQPPPL
jgi:acetyltransferase